MSAEPGPVRLRFWLWTAAMAALALHYALRVQPQLRIETDLLALLPQAESGISPAAAAAERDYTHALSRKLLVLVGAGDAQRAREAAAQFAATLRDAKVFAAVELEVEAAPVASALYREHRHGLLAEAQRLALQRGHGALLLDQAATDLYSLGLPRALPVAQDPFNFLGSFLAQQAAGAGAVRLEQGVLMLTRDATSYVLIAAEIAQEPFSVATQDRILPVVEAATARARDAGAQVLSSGVILHAAEAARRARAEIQWVGSFSLAGVALMILLTFRSPRPLLLSVVVLGSGALAALTACHLAFGSVTLIALVFGSGLIGVAVDYSTHFLADQFRQPADAAVAWSGRRALRHVGPAIAIGMGCAVLGYLSLGLTPLPGLRQMAVFSAVGLVVACCGVLCWYPVLAPPPRRGEPLPLRWTQRIDGALGRIRARIDSRSGRFAAAGLAGLALLSLARVEFADDVGLLHSAAPALVEGDRRVSELLQSAPESRFFLLHGATAEAVLQSEERLRESLDAQVERRALDGYRAVSLALPSVQRQRDNHALLAAQVYKSGGLGPRLMQELGFPPALVAQRLAEFESAAPPLRVESWLADASSAPWRELWLGADDHGYASIVSLRGIRDVAALRALPAGLAGVQFVDRVAAISELLGRYRRLALLLLAAAYTMIGVAMAMRYGRAAGARLLAAPVGAALLTLALLAAFGGALNLFHVLGLFVVLGLGVDYAVFLREGVAARAATVLAISLSTVGAVLCYGLLAFSATPFIRAIGLTLLIGVGCSWLLALLLQRPPPAAQAAT